MADRHPVRVAAFYRFAPLPDPAALRAPLLSLCERHGAKGTILLAPEGVNGTIAGTPAALDAVLAHLRSLPGCADLEAKFATAPVLPFHRMKVRLKREIVTMGAPGLDPAAVGDYVAPSDWNALIDDPETLLIDTRNDYEVRIGTFAGAVDPATASFSDFPAWFRDHRDALLAGKRRVAMFCTGGIRCEKATAFLKAEGVTDVFHLQGGILKYLETVEPAQNRFAGECFVFDQRVAVGADLAIGSHTLCHACRMPVSPEARASPAYADGISCPACHAARDDNQRAGYAERHRQTLLAQARGEDHVGRRVESD